MSYKHERALQVIASLNSNTQGLEDARRLALKALERGEGTTWNHRLVQLEPDCIRVCEVFYDAHGIPAGYDEGAVAQGETVDDVTKDLVHMLGAINKPILKPEDFVGEFLDNELHLLKEGESDAKAT